MLISGGLENLFALFFILSGPYKLISRDFINLNLKQAHAQQIYYQ